MRVQCCMCEFEKGGYCLKNKRRGKPTKIKSTKRRICELYSEDGMRVFVKFRTKEAHNAGVRRQAMRQAQFVKALEQVKKAGVTAFIEDAKEKDNDNA